MNVVPASAGAVLSGCLLVLSACLAAWSAYAQEETPFTRLFDTGAASPEPPAEAALANRTGWTLVPEDNVTHQFSGDAVLLNDKLALVLRKPGRGAEVYTRTASGLRHRATLGHVAAGFTVIDPCDALKILENTSGAVMIAASFKGDAPVTLHFRLTTGEGILEARPGEEAGFLKVQSKTRYVVVPDYFGDDMVFGAQAPLAAPLSSSEGERAPEGRVRGQRLTSDPPSPSLVSGSPRWSLCLPAENFCLNLLDGGEAIVMSVWQSSEQDAWLTPARADEAGSRQQAAGTEVLSSCIRCLKGKSIWLAFLESPGIWHAGAGPAKDDWKPAFPAKWRASFVRDNGVADSWDVDRGPQAEQTAGEHQGPLIVYPIDRSPETPLTASCPTDVMRNTLGVGPCQYILACEGLASQGDPTPNSVMNWVEKQFEGKKEKKAANDIQERLGQMVNHIADARLRIGRYAAFAGQVRTLLANKTGSEPFLAIVDNLDRFLATGQTPNASPERAKQLATEVSALVGKENPLPACQRLGEQLRSIGTVQDNTLAKCRMAVRRLRQQGRTIEASRSQDDPLAQEVQRLAEQMLAKK